MFSKGRGKKRGKGKGKWVEKSEETEKETNNLLCLSYFGWKQITYSNNAWLHSPKSVESSTLSSPRSLQHNINFIILSLVVLPLSSSCSTLFQHTHCNFRFLLFLYSFQQPSATPLTQKLLFVRNLKISVVVPMYGVTASERDGEKDDRVFLWPSVRLYLCFQLLQFFSRAARAHICVLQRIEVIWTTVPHDKALKLKI